MFKLPTSPTRSKGVGIIDHRGAVMSFFDLFWIFFLLLMLYPAIKQRHLELSRHRMIRKIQHARGSRLILLVHRQETMSLLGFPLLRFIDINDSEQVLRAIHMTDPGLPLDLILHTPGGLALPSLQIARAIRNHKGKVTVFIPHYAMSGGTILALAADEIVMTEHSVLGPVDPQVGQFPAASLLKVVQRKPVAEVDDQTLILADQAEKATAQMRRSLRELLEGRMGPEKADGLSRLLSEGTWTHDYPITCDEAQRLGLPVNVNMPEPILQLMTLFPQPTRRYPSVVYLPEPRRPRRGESAEEHSGLPSM